MSLIILILCAVYIRAARPILANHFDLAPLPRLPASAGFAFSDGARAFRASSSAALLSRAAAVAHALSGLQRVASSASSNIDAGGRHSSRSSSAGRRTVRRRGSSSRSRTRTTRACLSLCAQPHTRRARPPASLPSRSIREQARSAHAPAHGVFTRGSRLAAGYARSEPRSLVVKTGALHFNAFGSCHCSRQPAHVSGTSLGGQIGLLRAQVGSLGPRARGNRHRVRFRLKLADGH